METEKKNIPQINLQKQQYKKILLFVKQKEKQLKKLENQLKEVTRKEELLKNKIDNTSYELIGKRNNNQNLSEFKEQLKRILNKKETNGKNGSEKNGKCKRKRNHRKRI